MKNAFTQADTNLIVTCLSVGVLFGLFIAMLLGVFAAEAFDYAAWVSAFAAVTSTIVSALAVYYVSRTLDATRASLEVAHDASLNTLRIGRAQIRAYLNVKGARCSRDAHGHDIIHVLLKNNGATTAINVILKGSTSWAVLPHLRFQGQIEVEHGASGGDIAPGDEVEVAFYAVGKPRIYIGPSQVGGSIEIEYNTVCDDEKVTLWMVANTRSLVTPENEHDVPMHFWIPQRDDAQLFK